MKRLKKADIIKLR